MAKEKKLYIREFLNQEGFHAGAYVLVNLTDGEGTFCISDCSRIMDLTIDGYSGADRENTIHKLEILQRAVSLALNHCRANHRRATTRGDR